MRAKPHLIGIAKRSRPQTWLPLRNAMSGPATCAKRADIFFARKHGSNNSFNIGITWRHLALIALTHPKCPRSQFVASSVNARVGRVGGGVEVGVALGPDDGIDVGAAQGRDESDRDSLSGGGAGGEGKDSR